ncbi:MAG: UDP-3-O-[3-hydroxymyristoyl] N-acetylglucosamine deacetylase [Pirellulales bacterium]|nr:UDP-3-O-[3-hydroxymyristoyl] N-acetylglucosamine deacetylase [Pirellulales bacterium]
MDNEYRLVDNRRFQSTVGDTAAVEGFGYWTGRDIRVEFRPAEPDTGIVFVRRDLSGNPRIAAVVENRVDTPLRTSLRVGEACVDMVEHILSSLGGLDIDNCEVWVDQPEMPGCDGSSLPFVAAIDSVGRVLQDSPRKQIDVTGYLCDCEGPARIEARPNAGGDLQLEYHLDYPGTAIGRQHYKLTITPENFRRELAPSRTFLLREEAERLQTQGLGRRASFRDLLVYDQRGPIDNVLRFENECVRHKLLDLVGDLTMVGGSLSGTFSAWRSGHHLNARMVRTLLNQEIIDREYRRCA